MLNVSISRRYARALIDVAAETQSVEPVATQLAALARAVEQSPELRDLVMNPAYTRAQRLSVVEGLFKLLGKVDPVLENTVRLLVERNRLAYLPDIARAYGEMADARAGRVRGHVTSAVPLPAEALASLTQQLEKLTQRSVVLETKVDPSLIGGVSAQVGSVVYDGSVRSQLEAMRRGLLER